MSELPEDYRLERIALSRLGRYSKDRNLLAMLLSCFSLSMGFYSVLRAGVRFWGVALPGQCTDTVFNFSFSTGNCLAAGNWLVTRVSFATSAHAWSWVMYGTFGVLVGLWPASNLRFTFADKLRTIRFNGFRGFFFMGFGIAVHEICWFFTYFVVHPNPADIWFNLQVYGSFIAFCFIGIFAFWLLEYYKDMDLKLFAAGLVMLGLYYLGWASAGYPLSLDLKIGVTPLLNDLPTGFIEYASWVMVFTVVGMAYMSKQRNRR